MTEDIGHLIYKNNNYYSYDSITYEIVKNRDSNPDIKFYYHDDVYSKINWTIEPDISLEELYRTRAQQIRDKYDYLILAFSGGADTSQILNTFLKNNIFLDEVIHLHPLELTKNIKPTWDRTHKHGVIFEYEGAALPQLKLLAKNHPKTKITVVDTSKSFSSQFSNDKIVEANPDIFYTTALHAADQQKIETGSYFNAIRNIDLNTSMDRISDALKPRTVGLIVGADKPKYDFIDNKFYFYFTSSGRSNPAICPNPNIRYSSELFFWHPDSPLIPVKQCHILKKFFERSSPNLRKKVYVTLKSAVAIKALEADFVKELIYPDYNPSYYQKYKHAGDGVPATDFVGTKATQAVNSYYDYFLGNMSVSSNRRAVVGAKSKYYYVGNLTVDI